MPFPVSSGLPSPWLRVIVCVCVVLCVCVLCVCVRVEGWRLSLKYFEATMQKPDES